MRERPLLMSGPLVRAILDGRKTQTRRVVKLPGCDIEERDDGSLWPYYRAYAHGDDGSPWSPCPYGQVGDRLVVRESYAPNYFGAGQHGYMADWTNPDGVPTPRWTPSIHMPLAHSRLTLRITDVRVERLQDINEEDARAEGCEPVGDRWRDYMPEREAPRQTFRTARESFFSLWESINGTESLVSNPWLWCVSFEREVTP